MLFNTNDKIIFIGDSVTDCERTEIGEGRGNTGNGYVTQLEALLKVHYPKLSTRIINRGTSGNTVRDLKARWEKDVLAHAPDWVFIMIGVNDVWRQFDEPARKELHVYLDEYSQTLEALVKNTLPTVKGVILVSPVFMETQQQEPMRAKINSYQQAMKKIAQQYNLLYVDVQSAFDNHLRHFHSSAISWDRIHPNQTGHMIIASSILNSIGFAWDSSL